MSMLRLSPLQTFHRYYSAELDSRASKTPRSTDEAIKSALEHMPRDTIENFIQTAAHALNSLDETGIRDMFKDGHFYFAWNSPDAATLRLKDIVGLAKQ